MESFETFLMYGDLTPAKVSAELAEDAKIAEADRASEDVFAKALAGSGSKDAAFEHGAMLQKIYGIDEGEPTAFVV